MAKNSGIEWTEATWNPIVGCSAVSQGCKNCYAETMAKRLAGMAKASIAAGKNPGRTRHYIDTINERGKWNGQVVEVPEALTDPLKTKKPTRYFVNSMSDLFHESVTDEYIDRVFAVMALCPQHTFQVLTKRPERMREYLASTFGPVQLGDVFDRTVNIVAPWIWEHCGGEEAIERIVEARKHGYLKNVWLGVSVEYQQTADERIPLLVQTPAAVRWLSVEPLLGPVDLRKWLMIESDLDGNTRGFGYIDWAIIGGESGPKARPMHPDWVRSLRDQCMAAGVPFFFKQWGSWFPVHSQTDDVDEHGHVEIFHESGELIGRCHDWDDYAYSVQIGKKKAGRILDRRTWDEYPEIAK